MTHRQTAFMRHVGKMDVPVETLPDHLGGAPRLPGSKSTLFGRPQRRKARIGPQHMRTENEAELVQRERTRPVARADERKDILGELGQHDVVLAYRQLV